MILNNPLLKQIKLIQTYQTSSITQATETSKASENTPQPISTAFHFGNQSGTSPNHLHTDS